VTVVFLPSAENDILTAHQQYESVAPGLGDRFAQAIKQTTRLLEALPEMFGEVAPQIRAAPVRRFPYVIYYRSEGDHVIVLAITHGHQLHQGRERRQ
jgi:plasmid stabilization system protein ParE